MNHPLELTIDGDHWRLFRDFDMIEEYKRRNPRNVKRLGMIAIQLFRNHPEMDNFSVFTEEERLRQFGYEDMCTWMGGIAVDKERQKVLHTANREGGSFRDQAGWNPNVLIKDVPSEQDFEDFVTYENQLLDKEWAQFEEE